MTLPSVQSAFDRTDLSEGNCSLAPSAGLAILDAAKGSKQPNCAEQRGATRQSLW
jgi:hypothetical protein